MPRWTLSLVVLLLGCGSPATQEEPAVSTIPFVHAGGDSGAEHLLKVPVVVNGHATTFVFDTGIGITLVDDDLLASWGLAANASYTGKRMSGQEVTVPLTRVPWLSVAGLRQDDVQVGVWDMDAFLPRTPEFAGVEGFLSLHALAEVAFTLDYARGELIVEDEAGLAAREAAGSVVPLEVHRDGPTLTVFFELLVPGGPPARVELDLGGRAIALDASFMQRLGVDPDGEGVTRVEKRDETGFDYTRHFATVAGPIAPAAAPQLEQRDFKALFQEIIYDGLIGDDYLSRYTATFDLPGGRLILAPRSSEE